MRKNAFASRLSAALVVTSVLVAAPYARDACAAEQAPISEEARTHFAAGVALLKDPAEPRYEEAYREFKAAYAATPSFKILGNLGLSAMKIERDAEAIWAFETYLKESGPELTGPEREQIERDLLTLKSGVVTVTVSSDPPGATITDLRQPITGAEVRNSYGEAGQPIALGLRRGHHVITAKLPGYVDAKWEFETSGTALPPHVFQLQKEATAERPTVQERPVPTAAYVSGGVALALLLSGGYFGLRAEQQHSDYAKLNDGSHVADAESTRSTGQTLNTVTDVFLGGAIVAAGVTAYFVLTRPTVERPVGASALSPILPTRVAPTWGTRGGGATAVWNF